MTTGHHGPPALAPTRAALADLVDPVRRRGGTVALVPTMGALHQGHASLLRLARERAGADGLVVASVFVNPLQFGPGEDLDRYPRTLEQDLEVCAAQGVDVVFAPAAEEVYPGGDPQVSIAPGPVADVLEGASRPGHFAGVLTVVAKLFGLVRPDVAVFGEKDYQQLVLVRRMVADLCLPVEVVGAETAREPDGLARSSRNRYLGEDERLRAAAVPRVLAAAVDAARLGVDAALDAARGVLTSSPGVEVDYLALTDPELRDLTAPGAAPVTAPTPGRVLLAARVGSTRLIDNLPLVVGLPESRPAGTPADPTHAPAPAPETAHTGGHR